MYSIDSAAARAGERINQLNWSHIRFNRDRYCSVVVVAIVVVIIIITVVVIDRPIVRRNR